MKVSFILPVYKVEKYLSICIESLLSQTYEDFEILLIDDGSPDKCPVLCDEWAKRDERIRALHKTNGGLSDARNYGLERAQGDYIIFVDSDDFWVGKESLEKIMALVEAHPECDFISFNCSYYNQNANTYTKWPAYDERLAVPTDKDTAMRSLVASGTLPMSACLKVISKKSLSDMGLTFIKGILSEDIPWFIDLLDGSKKCMFVNEYIYAYRQGVSGSITSSICGRTIDCQLNIIERELEKIAKRSFEDSTKDYLKSFLAYELSICLGELGQLDKSIRETYYERLRRYKWLLKYKQNPKARKVALLHSLLGLRITRYFLEYYFAKRQIVK